MKKKKDLIPLIVCLVVMFILIFVLIFAIATKDKNTNNQTLSTESSSESKYTTGTIEITTTEEFVTTEDKTPSPTYEEVDKEESSTFDMTTEYDDGEPYTGEDNN